MLISVIIPVYNVERYLSQCLNSVIYQTYKNLEIICVNDCSTDSSLQILNDFAQKDSRIKIINNEKNIGLGLTRNVGIKAATGDFIHCLDSDDYLSSKSAYELLSNIVQNDKTIDLIDFKYNILDESDGSIKNHISNNIDNIYYRKTTNIQKTPEIMRLYTPSAWLKFIRREFIIDKKLFYNDYRCLEDIEYSLKLILMAKKVQFIPDVLITYRRGRPNSLLSKKFDYLDNIVKDKNWAEENSLHLSESSRKAFLGYIYKILIGNFYEAYKQKAIGLKEILEITTKLKSNVLIDNKILPLTNELNFITELNKERELNKYNYRLIRNAQGKNNNTIMLSIIIPVYNVENFLLQCLKSVSKQTYENIEIICVDDCSTDASYEILTEYTKHDPRIKIIKHDTNQGLGAARNSGLKVAQGDYIHFLDSDDWIIYNEAYEELIELLKKYQEPDILHFHFRKSLCGTDYIIKDVPKDIDNYNKVVIPRETPEAFDSWERYVWTKLFKRDFLISNNIKFSLIRSMEDFKFSADTYVKCNSLCYVDKLIVNYTTSRPNSLITKAHTVLKDIVKEFKYNADLYKNLPKELKYKMLGLDYFQISNNVQKSYKLGYVDKKYLKKLEKELSVYDVENYICSDLKPHETELKINFDKLIKETTLVKCDKNDILLSVILPVYNSEKYIEQCLHTITTQSYKNIEIICIDDDSKDNSYNIIKNWQKKDNRIKLIKNETNLGVGPTRNIGIKNAKGKYIHFLNSDDFLVHNDVYTKLISSLIFMEQPEILHFHYKNHKFNTLPSYSVPQKNLSLLRKIVNPSETIEAYDNWERYVWTKLYKKDFLTSNNIEFSSIRSMSDYRFSAETYIKCKTLCYIDTLGVNYTRERPNSLVSKVATIIPELFEEFKYNATLYENLPEELKYKFLGADYCPIRTHITDAYNQGHINADYLRWMENEFKNYELNKFIFTHSEFEGDDRFINFDKIIAKD